MTAVAEEELRSGGGSAPECLAVAALDLACRFSGGATLWCVSPVWRSHAHHLAVEFVHPVIVGKPALPAVAVEGADPAPTLRLRSRPGDVVVAVGAADDPVIHDLFTRAEAWGLTTVMLVAGTRSGPIRADHLIEPGRADHLSGPDRIDPAIGAWDGSLVAHYHLLWELTHVALEHPGLLEPDPPDPAHCPTCADEARVAEVRSSHGSRADVMVAGRLEVADVSLVAPVVPGSLLLLHAGVALSVLGGDGR